MINLIKDAICENIYREFSELGQYEIYTETVLQGFNTPCFFVMNTSNKSEQFMNRRYFKNNVFSVHYFPSMPKGEVVDYDEVLENVDNGPAGIQVFENTVLENSKELNFIADRLFAVLEYICVNGELMRGTNMESSIQGGVLVFSVDYNVFVDKIYDHEKMGALNYTLQ